MHDCFSKAANMSRTSLAFVFAWNVVGTKTRRIIGIMTMMSVNIVKRVSEGHCWCPWCVLACFPAPACKMQAKASEDDI
jgi:uncharacterized membrane protein